MSSGGHRYCYSLLRGYVRRDMWKLAGPVWFWRMWGVRKTLRFIVSDTLWEWRKPKGDPNG